MPYPLYRVRMFSGGYTVMNFVTEAGHTRCGDCLIIPDHEGREYRLNGAWAMQQIGDLGDYAKQTRQEIESEIAEEEIICKKKFDELGQVPQEEIDKLDVLKARRSARIRRDQNEKEDHQN